MLAIKHVKLIDGTGRPPAGDAVILLNGRKITAAGPGVPIPEDASVIDGRGMTAVPAFSDMHTHMGGSSTFDHSPCGDRLGTYEFSEARESFLRWGVTTVRTCGDRASEILNYRDSVNSGKIISPRVLSCGPFIQDPDGHPWATVYMRDPTVGKEACVFADTDMTLEQQIADIALLGVDFIKVFYAHLNKMDYPNPVPRITKEQLCRAVAAAHSHGLKCACHVDGPEEMSDAADAGVDYIEHIIGAGCENGEYSDEIVEKVVSSGAVVTPTMVSIQRFDDSPGFRSVWDELNTAVKQFYDAGVPMMVGCDSGIPFVPFGESLHDEMEMLANAGIPVPEVLRMATLGNMTHIGLDTSLGSIEPGKTADIVLLGSDPLENIRNTRDVRLVFKEGRVVFDAH